VDIEGPIFVNLNGDQFWDIVLVKDRRFCAIRINDVNAYSISIIKQNGTPQRPIIHDVLLDLIVPLEFTVEKVIVTKYEISIDAYFSILYLKRGDKTIEVDCGPSDAIAIALRQKAPIYINEDLLITDEAFLNEVERAKMAFAASTLSKDQISVEEAQRLFDNLDPKKTH